MNWEDWAENERDIRCAYDRERDIRWQDALGTIATVSLPGEVGYRRLDGKDAEGFIHIARRALGLEG